MNTKDDDITLLSDDFSRRFSLRARSLMWYLGAGASASSGIPTAADMIWDFKRQLYLSQRRIAPKTIDISNPAIRRQIQAHIDSARRFPPLGADDEYAALFEAAFPSESDRRAYIDAKIAGARPSYGHIAIATLMRADLARLLWTTNFDPMIADACAAVFGGTGALTSIALERPLQASEIIADERWPIEVKLHGDFRSRRLKNTSDELRQQDAQLRQALVDSCARFGAVVVGYSGRDDSIMSAFETAVDRTGAFPQGLFWLQRSGQTIATRVRNLLVRAMERGLDVGLIEIENFDEVLRDLLRMVSGVDTVVLDRFAQERRRWTAAPKTSGKGDWPVIRLNALPLVATPALCRRVVCKIGGHKEVREAAARVPSSYIVARTQSGVLAFARDVDLRRAFASYEITEFDLHTIEDRRLRYDSGERGLIREALTHAIARCFGLHVIRHRHRDSLYPIDPRDAKWSRLRAVVGDIVGTVPQCSGLTWHEGVSTRLDWVDDRLWLLFEPKLIMNGLSNGNRDAGSEFGRERTFKRYNSVLNALIDFWAARLSGGGVELRALGISDGVDAVFRLSRTTAFSRRLMG